MQEYYPLRLRAAMTPVLLPMERTPTAGKVSRCSTLVERHRNSRGPCELRMSPLPQPPVTRKANPEHIITPRLEDQSPATAYCVAMSIAKGWEDYILLCHPLLPSKELGV